MAYDKNETRANCGKAGLGQKKYRFKWSLAYFGPCLARIMLGYVLCMVGGIIFWPLIFLCNLSETATYILAMAVVPLTIELGVTLYLFHRSGNGMIRYTTIEPGKITIVRICGKTVLEGVSSIVHVTKEELDEDTSYTSYDSDSGTESTEHGLSMSSEKFLSKKYGEFTRICVNFKELAMVTCADGKKYLINYPMELLEQMPDVHVYKPKLKLKWRVGRVVAVISIIVASIALFILLSEGMFIEFFVLLLACFFLLLPFGLSMIIETVKHIRIGTDRITILLASHPKTIVLDNIESIQYVTRKELEPSTTYAKQFTWFQRPRTCRGLSMWGKVFSNYKYGKFTRICNNFDELAMVTLANGKKYLINYPKELLEKKG